jgi:HrpA-like RNA helicase
MGEYVGEFVDYVASAGKTANPQAKIIFKLDRLVLDELTEDPLLSKYSCLVIDEAHERTISIDVIIGLITNLLKQRQDFKVIVTSASMDIQLFENYFRTKTLKVSGRMFPVTIYYKDYANFREGDKFQVARKIERVINE